MARGLARRLTRGGLIPLAVFGALAVSACDAGTPDAAATPTAVAGPPAGGAASTPPGAGALGDAGTPSKATNSTKQALPDGTHYGYASKVDIAERTLVLDKVEMLTGAAARKAYQKANPGVTDGPPNDYLLINDNKLLRTLSVADDVAVSVIDTSKGDTVTPSKSSFAKLPAFLAGKDNSTLVKLTVKGGKVTALESVYLP